MKVSIVFLAVCVSLSHAAVPSNRVDDVRSITDIRVEFSRKLDEMLMKLEYLLPPHATFSGGRSDFYRQWYLALTDLERTEDDRRSVVSQLFQKAGISEKKRFSHTMIMDEVFMILNPIAERTPLVGKLVYSALAKMVTSKKFVFGSQEDRKRILQGELVSVLRKVKKDRKLSEEFVKIKIDNELLMLAQKVYGFQF